MRYAQLACHFAQWDREIASLVEQVDDVAGDERGLVDRGATAPI